MAKKRKLSRNSTPTSNPDPQPETQSQPEPEHEPLVEEQPIKHEPIEKETPIKREPIEEEDPIQEDDGDDDDDDDDEDAADEEKPQTLETASDDQEESDPQSIQKILELFPKEQLVDLLRGAAVAHPDILKEIHRIADVDPAHRKIFVHGLGWDTTAETLTTFFSQFGEVEDCKAVIDKATGRSKGYGFILFKHRKGACNALKEPQKKIGSRMTACQLASAGPVPPPAPPVSEYTQRKIYVSNVGADMDSQKLLQFFAKFGEIEEGPLGIDKVTGKPKGFCLFVYKTVESARKALEEPQKNYEGLVLHCQKAVDGPKGFKNLQHHGGGGGGGGGGSHGGKSKNAAGFNNAAQGGHLMAPPAPTATGMGYNHGVASVAPGLNPALGQALTALLATQGGGLGGLTNLLAGAAGPVVNQGQMLNSGMQQGGYGGQVGGYRVQAPVQGGYGGGQIGYGNGGARGQQGYGPASGGPPYMGHH